MHSSGLGIYKDDFIWVFHLADCIDGRIKIRMIGFRKRFLKGLAELEYF
jgi:hypothetical protein